jgi:hypothetical protein
VPDAAAAIVEPVPVSSRLRAAVRLAPVFGGWAIVWCTLVLAVAPRAAGGATLEAAALLVVAIAVALVFDGPGRQELAGPVAPLLVLGAGVIAPGPLSLFDGSTAGVAPALAVLVVAALVTIVWQLRDPFARRRPRSAPLGRR